MQDFYPRSPRGERPSADTGACPSAQFLSTLPARGATRCGNAAQEAQTISIHAPREGSDGLRIEYLFSVKAFLSTLPARGATTPPAATRWSAGYFYPRSPRGERPATAPLDTHVELVFLSTLPARGATWEAVGDG